MAGTKLHPDVLVEATERFQSWVRSAEGAEAIAGTANGQVWEEAQLIRAFIGCAQGHSAYRVDDDTSRSRAGHEGQSRVTTQKRLGTCEDPDSSPRDGGDALRTSGSERVAA